MEHDSLGELHTGVKRTTIHAGIDSSTWGVPIHLDMPIFIPFLSLLIDLDNISYLPELKRIYDSYPWGSSRPLSNQFVRISVIIFSLFVLSRFHTIIILDAFSFEKAANYQLFLSN